MTIAAEPMTRRVLVAPPEMALCDAWELLERERFRHLPIVSSGVLLGILSDRDILVRSKLVDGELQVPSTPVGEAATAWPIVCRARTDVRDLVHRMVENKIDAVPVVDAANHLLGLVTLTDLMLLLVGDDEAKLPLPYEFEIHEFSAAA